MGKLFFRVDDGGAKKKIAALQAAANDMRPVYETIGRVLINRVRLCFKMGIDPWGNKWQAIKWRAPRSRMVAVKDKAGNVVDYKRKFGKDGKLLLTKTGKKQVEANRAGKAGQPLRDTARLNRSISSQVDGEGVTIGTNVKYARIHQFGGEIRPKNKPFLAFPGPTGEIIFAKRVTIPARPYLPLRKGSAVVALPPAWSVLVVNALKSYFRKKVAEVAA